MAALRFNLVNGERTCGTRLTRLGGLLCSLRGSTGGRGGPPSLSVARLAVFAEFVLKHDGEVAMESVVGPFISSR